MIMIAGSSRVLRDEINYYEESLQFKALLQIMIVNMIVFSLNNFVNLNISIRRHAFNYAGPIFFISES